MKRAIKITMTILGLVSFLVMEAMPATAGGEKVDPIDIKLKIDLEKTVTTRDIVDCYINAKEAWDKALNIEYANITKIIGSNKDNKNNWGIYTNKSDFDKALENIKISQREWIKHRDREFEFINSYFSLWMGSRFQIENAMSKMNIVKKRVYELRAYMEAINQ